MRRTLRSTLRQTAIGLVTLGCLSSVALAEPTAAPAKKPGSLFDRLPSGKIQVPTTVTMPKSIPATEKVDGFYVEVPAGVAAMGRNNGPTYAQVFASKEESTIRNSGQQQVDPVACFQTAYPAYSNEVNWSGSLGTSATVQNYLHANYGGNQYGSVQLVRSDRVVKEEGDKLTYEVTFAYVDAETMGVRLHSKQTFEMTKLDDLPGKVSVWGSKSDDQVLFMARRLRHEKERFFFGPLMVNLNGQQVLSSSESCPIVFSLKAGKNVATSAVVQVDAILDVQDVNEDGESGGFMAGLPQRAAPFAPTGQREAKIRPMRVGLSSSWMSQDLQPVISVSHGWAGKVRTQPI